jgi:hypothetical protein
MSISLVIFDSARQHWGRHDIYQKTLLDLASKDVLDSFANLLVHIKVDPFQEGELERCKTEMVPFYEDFGFKVEVTTGVWNHGAESHQIEYSKDLIKMYSNEINSDYVLHLESDWLFDPKQGARLEDIISLGCAYLYSRPSIMSLRFPRFQDEVQRIENLQVKYPDSMAHVRVTEDEFTSLDGTTNTFYCHNDNLSLNPCIMRSRDMFWATRMLINYTELQKHVEMGFSRLLAYPASVNKEYPYAIFDPQDVTVLHIGTPEGQEDVSGNVFETIVDKV